MSNMLVDGGAIGAAINFGDITSGGPVVDLAIGWMLFDAEAPEEFRRAIPHADGATRLRGAAWVLRFALMYLTNPADNPRLNSKGRRLLPSVMSGELA